MSGYWDPHPTRTSLGTGEVPYIGKIPEELLRAGVNAPAFRLVSLGFKAYHKKAMRRFFSLSFPRNTFVRFFEHFVFGRHDNLVVLVLPVVEP